MLGSRAAGLVGPTAAWLSEPAGNQSLNAGERAQLLLKGRADRTNYRAAVSCADALGLLRRNSSGSLGACDENGCNAALQRGPADVVAELKMAKLQVARWLEPCLWFLILIRMASVVLVPNNVTRVPLGLVALRPTGDVLLASVASTDGVRLVTVAAVAVLSRILVNIAMFVLLTKYAPGLASRYLPQRQLRIVDWLRSTRTRSALLVICSVHPTKVVVVACALARVKFLFFVVSVILGNTLAVGLYLIIGRHFSAELNIVIDWIWAHRWWITFALIPLLAVTIVFAVRRGRR